MARLPYLTRDDLPPADHALLDRDLNLYAVLAHSPAAARAFGAPALYVRHDSALDPRLRELAILQIGYATGTRYEYVHHVEIGLANGLTAADIHAIARATAGDDEYFAPLERAVLGAARELVAGTALRDETYAVLADALAADCLIDLIVVISVYCGVVRLLGALEVQLEPRYDALLREFPLP
ncbi:MAG: carboxymuconolactone decarboxylase family protein [Gammaproteobacteria bacterium]|jgi:alkylhydroperoxidase family enzyme